MKLEIALAYSNHLRDGTDSVLPPHNIRHNKQQGHHAALPDEFIQFNSEIIVGGPVIDYTGQQRTADDRRRIRNCGSERKRRPHNCRIRLWQNLPPCPVRRNH